MFQRRNHLNCKDFLGVDFGYYDIIVVSDEKGREIMRMQGDGLIQRKCGHVYKQFKNQSPIAPTVVLSSIEILNASINIARKRKETYSPP